MMPHEVFNMNNLADMLHRGNSGIPYWCKPSFYGAKKALLSWLGSPCGHDIQELSAKCWDCNGEGGNCRKCSGSGLYYRRYVWLDKYKFGPHSFHVPCDGLRLLADVKPTITGLISHSPYPNSADCAVSIAWLFNRAALREDARYHYAERIGWSGKTGQAWHDVAVWCRERNAEYMQQQKVLADAGHEIPF